MITQILNRELYRSDGIFGAILREDGTAIAETLEHSFNRSAILPPGTYICERGMHKLKRGDPFETFEVKNVPGHWGVLFHRGNYNADSEGCVLLGEWLVQEEPGSHISGSRVAFDRWMKELEGVEQFTLIVKE